MKAVIIFIKLILDIGQLFRQIKYRKSDQTEIVFYVCDKSAP